MAGKPTPAPVPSGFQPIEVPVVDQTALPAFAPIEVTPYESALTAEKES